MKTTKIISNRYLQATLLVVAGIFLGWLIFHQSGASKNEVQEAHEHSEAVPEIWTCSMHPQIRMEKPGQCPICAMDLIPLQQSTVEIDNQAIEMSESAMKLAEVQTSIVQRGTASKEIRLYGKIQLNEALLQSQTAHIPGRIEQLLVNTTGEQVTKGQLIARIYSPELVTAQKELLEAIQMKEKYPALAEAAREKLRLWKLSDSQIESIEESGEVKSNFEVYSNTSGIVKSLNVSVGNYIQKGSSLFEVADLSKLWAVFDAYETDLPWLRLGQKIDFTLQAIPGKTFTGKISFIDPSVDATTRITKIRVEIPRASAELKPEMFANGTVQSTQKGAEQQLLIPHSAVLWTGKRSIVYVKLPETEHPTFKMRMITLGASMNESYVIEEGLAENEEIVTNGTFSVDAAAQLAGKPSMMNADQPGHPMKQEMNMNSAAQGESLKNQKSTTNPTSEVLHQQLKVSGKCEMCKDRIETAAKSVAGVTQAEWSADKQLLDLSFDSGKTSIDLISKAIAAVGHDTEKHRASNSVYNQLPECCLYREK